MTEADALATMKRKCAVLSQIFTDDILTAFLNDYEITEADGVTNDYNIRQAIYDALTSAMSTQPTSISRGGVTTTLDLAKVRSQFATVGTVRMTRDQN